MNRVVKISEIRGLGVFRRFQWPESLPEFQRYNVVYGWNGSGKTLLSRVFAGLESGQTPSCHDVAVVLSSGDSVRGEGFSGASGRVKVRVFNRDFVEESVYRTKGTIDPIYVVGEKAKEKQRQLDEVVAKLEENHRKTSSKERDRKSKERRLEELCTQGARAVRDTLRIPGREYEREQFRNDIEALITEDRHDKHVLEEGERERVLQLTDAEPREKLSPIRFSFASCEEAYLKAGELCDTSLMARGFDDLSRHPGLNVWLERGLELHKKHESEMCLFCTQVLPSDRLLQLEAQFNVEYRSKIAEITKSMREARTAIDEANAVSLPDPNLFYPDMREEYSVAHARFQATRKYHTSVFKGLTRSLEEKRRNPFVDLESDLPQWDLSDEVVDAINKAIAEHNEKVDNHDEEVRKAKLKLKHHIIAERVEEYRSLETGTNQVNALLEELRQESTLLDRRRSTLEGELTDHRTPADELNREVSSYLGHSELQFEVEKTGYKITRNGQRAEALSEGEKTAISFLYFLKCLKGRDFSTHSGVVVIDDPISSLDSNSLYYAFGFMKSQLRDVGQLFVLTHSFLFFRQVKNWFWYLGERRDRDVGYYQLDVRKDAGSRNSSIVELDPLLKNYESEYHYLFSVVNQAAQEDSGSGLEQYYYLPNVVRRLLEAFLEFKVPGREAVHGRLQVVEFDQAKKERIRRFCDTHSHSRVIDEPEQDPVILSEACAVAIDVLELIRAADEEHFSRMVQLCSDRR